MSTDSIWNWLLRLLQRETGFHPSHTRWATLNYRLAELAQQKGYASAEEYLEKLQTRPDNREYNELVETLLNNETSFFRDMRLFELLKEQILPKLLEPMPLQLRVWSAACATGQEPYSIAMLWERHFAKRARIELHASDLSLQALDQAHKGVYPARDIDRQLPSHYREYFHTYGDQKSEQLQLNASLQSKVSFKSINLIQPWPLLPEMDLILMRNVLIYLEPVLKAQILTRVAKQLRPGGYLILGITESLVPLPPEFQPAHLDRAGGCFIRR